MARGQAGRAALWLIAIFGALGGLWYYAQTRPQILPVWARGWLPGLADQTRPLYRWRDGQGRLQITDQPPKDRPHDEVRYRPDTNVIPKAAPK